MAATLIFRLTGGAINETPADSLGGIMSSTALSGTALNNLFDDVSPAERVAGIAKQYRALDVYNSGDAQAESIELYMSTATSSTGTVLHLGHDATNNPHISGWDGETIVSDITDPASPVISFAERTSGTKLALPAIPAGQACRIWIDRIVTADVGNTTSDLGTLAVDYA